MKPFEFFNVPRVVFGRGQFSRVGEIAASLGRRAMVVTNVSGAAREPMLERLGGLLAAAGVSLTLCQQHGEPQVSDVQAAVDAARKAGCDLVIGLGGGSAIDAAKAAAGILANGGEPLDYMEVVGKGQKLALPALPWIAIPTTAGTGAEVTRNAVIGCPEKHFKASLRSEHLLARVALVDAELCISAPPKVTACSGMDALCQLIESYTSLSAQPFTDGLALQGMALAARSLQRAFTDGADLDAREDMSAAATMSGITLANAGLGAVHGFAAPLGANFPAPHGAVCAALLPHVMAANVKALRESPDGSFALARYADVGRTLTGRQDMPDAQAIDAGIAFTAELSRDLKIPPLGNFGLTAERVTEMIQLAAKSSSMRYNPVKLSDETLAEILTKAI